jgi:hypothetical protein
MSTTPGRPSKCGRRTFRAGRRRERRSLAACSHYMVVVPTANDVTLVAQPRVVDHVGCVLTVLGIEALVGVFEFERRTHVVDDDEPQANDLENARARTRR